MGKSLISEFEIEELQIRSVAETLISYFEYPDDRFSLWLTYDNRLVCTSHGSVDKYKKRILRFKVNALPIKTTVFNMPKEADVEYYYQAQDEEGKKFIREQLVYMVKELIN